MKRKAISVISAMILIILMITGCTQFKKNTEFWDRYKEGFATRYGNQNVFGNNPSLIAAVGGRQNEYDLDNVTLDFIYGGESIYDVAVYVSPEYSDLSFVNELHDDYKNIPELYFINEETQTEFTCGPFDIEVSWARGLYYHFVDTWTVPKEVFNKEAGRIAFWLFSFQEVKTDDGQIKYMLRGNNVTALIYVCYQKSGDKIRLSDEWW